MAVIEKLVSYTRDRTQGWFKRKPDGFLERLREQSFVVLLGTEALVEYTRAPNHKNRSRVRNLEQKADELRRSLVSRLNYSFVTPIDREDLFALSRAIDDVLDYTYSTATEMDMLGVDSGPALVAMVELLHEGAVAFHDAICALETRSPQANAHTLRVRGVEKAMETVYTQALADLFQEPEDLKQVVAMMKQVEIYRHVFRAIRSTRQAADILGDILVKFY